jgi:glycine betaine catabolism B
MVHYGYMNKVFSAVVGPLGRFLDRSSMYQVMLYTLGGLVLATLMFGFLELIPQSPFEQVRSLALVLGIALILSVGMAYVRGIPANHQSSIITALIIFFLVSPAREWGELHIIASVTALAIVSKYILVWRGQHLLNAAALGVVFLTLPGYFEANWWIASPTLFVPLLLLGALVVTKVRAWRYVLTFVGVGFLVYLFEEVRFGSDITETWSIYFTSYPTLFLAAFMLTEPFSLPPTERLRLWYAGTVGFLSSTALFIPIFAMSPELALIVGNLLFYPSTLRQKLFLVYQGKQEVSPGVYEFRFEKPVGMRFVAGQYLEWMVPHAKPDARGIRRYFTIVSDPDDEFLSVAMRMPIPSSTYKQTLASLAVGSTIIASQRAGDFVLPKDTARKLGWIAGGIGVTPFVSQSRSLVRHNETRDISLLYAAASLADLSYRAELERVAKVVPVLSGGGDTAVQPDVETGFITAEMIARRIPDYKERTWYVSGPPRMVAASVSALRLLGVKKRNIVEDFFPGLS